MVQRCQRSRIADDSINRVRSLSREDILDKVERDSENNNKVRAVFRYGRRLPNISVILLKNWKTVTEDDRRLREVYPDPPMAQWHKGEECQGGSLQGPSSTS